MSTQVSPTTSDKTDQSKQVHNEVKYFYYNGKLQLESGLSLSNVRLAYHTFGTLNAAKDNVVWIIHALTGNSNPLEWWPDMVGENCVIDPNKHFIVCANSLGSHYGSTCPLDCDPISKQPYFHNFPMLTTRDLAKSYLLLKEYLGISSINTLIGASIGGQQALEWAVIDNHSIKNLVLIATSAYSTPWVVAFNETQRMAIRADQTWEKGGKNPAVEGLKAARAIAMLSYRHPLGYNTSQAESEAKIDNFRASSYQAYQGLKLANRYNAYSYYLVTKAMDSHDVGRDRGGREAALGLVNAKTYIISIDNDILFTPADQQYLHDHIQDSTLYNISSIYGHDGFLVERQEVARVLAKALVSE